MLQLSAARNCILYTETDTQSAANYSQHSRYTAAAAAAAAGIQNSIKSFLESNFPSNTAIKSCEQGHVEPNSIPIELPCNWI